MPNDICRSAETLAERTRAQLGSAYPRLNVFRPAERATCCAGRVLHITAYLAGVDACQPPLPTRLRRLETSICTGSTSSDAKRRPAHLADIDLQHPSPTRIRRVEKSICTGSTGGGTGSGAGSGARACCTPANRRACTGQSPANLGCNSVWYTRISDRFRSTQSNMGTLRRLPQLGVSTIRLPMPADPCWRQDRHPCTSNHGSGHGSVPGVCPANGYFLDMPTVQGRMCPFAYTEPREAFPWHPLLSTFLQ